LQYDPGDAIPHQNTTQESRGPILIQDLRGQSRSFSFENCGFAFVEMESTLTPEDFHEEEKVKRVYYSEIQALLLKYFGAKRVEILEHVVIDLETCHLFR